MQDIFLKDDELEILFTAKKHFNDQELKQFFSKGLLKGIQTIRDNKVFIVHSLLTAIREGDPLDFIQIFEDASKKGLISTDGLVTDEDDDTTTFLHRILHNDTHSAEHSITTGLKKITTYLLKKGVSLSFCPTGCACCTQHLSIIELCKEWQKMNKPGFWNSLSRFDWGKNIFPLLVNWIKAEQNKGLLLNEPSFLVKEKEEESTGNWSCLVC